MKHYKEELSVSRWSREEKEIIRKYYPHGGTIAVKEHLEGRTKDEIRKMAKYLGVRKKPYAKQSHYRNDEYSKKTSKTAWTDREIEILCRYYPIEGALVAQEHLPGRTTEAICVKAAKLHIIKPWTEEEMKILAEYYPTEGKDVVKRLPDRTSKQCTDMAKFRGYDKKD